MAVLDAATFAVAIGALASVRVPEHPIPPSLGRNAWSRMLAGLVHLRRVQVLSRMTLAYSVAMLVLGFYESVTFAVIAALHRPASFLGLLMSVQAVGSIVGGLSPPGSLIGLASNAPSGSRSPPGLWLPPPIPSQPSSPPSWRSPSLGWPSPSAQ
ncbi:MAG TPA: hypothetical protein VMF65_12405 [Acidimicrobiales bacterium]|nr:hypothetical protein [Acidimicrobiales bacterium]